MNSANPKVGHRSFRTLMKSFVAIGATSALMLAGLAFVAVAPASASSTVAFSSISSPQVSGAALNFTVTVSPAAADTVNITSGCSLGGTVTAVANGGTGIATFASTYFKTGTSCMLVATDASAGGTASDGPITVTAGSATQIAFTTAPPANATVGVALPAFKVSVEDTYGNVVTTGTGSVDTITISTASAGCSVAGTDANVAAAGGVATFSNVNIAAGSSCALTATDTLSPDNSFTAVTSGAISVVSNTPTELGFTTEPPATVAAGTVLPTFVVSVEASNGVALQGGVGTSDVIVLT